MNITLADVLDREGAHLLLEEYQWVPRLCQDAVLNLKAENIPGLRRNDDGAEAAPENDQDPEEEEECLLCSDMKKKMVRLFFKILKEFQNENFHFLQDFHKSPCGHKYCLECWRSHFKTQIKDNNKTRIRCMGCPTFMAFRVVEEILGDKDFIKDYREKIFKSFLENSAAHTPCPAKNCDRVFEQSIPFYKGWRRGDCGCGQRSCLDRRCAGGGIDKDAPGEWHGPLDCDLYLKWQLRQQNEDAESLRWILVNTKVN